MSKLNFGTAGSPRNPENLSTVDGIKRSPSWVWIAWRLSCAGCADEQGDRQAGLGGGRRTEISGFSVHAPYFINLNAREAEKIQASQLPVDTMARGGGFMRRR